MKGDCNMKYIFVINPKAGPKNATADIKNMLERSNRSDSCEYYVTKCANDAASYVSKYADDHYNEELCFVACGGDGTLNEVATGAVGHKNAAVAVFPVGSGNDFVKYFGGKEAFLDVDALFEGYPEDIDILKIDDRYSVNVCNFGFDTTVADTMQKVKRYPIIGGSNAYYCGIAKALMTSMKNRCKIYADGKLLNPSGKILLCTLANGSHVGGSFNCAPRSDCTDGFIEVCVVAPIHLPKFLKLLPFYERGTHLDAPEFEGILTYTRAKSVRIEAPEGFRISLDGELAAKNEVTVECLNRAVRLMIPRGAHRASRTAAHEAVNA